eukprot:TRINITY_DN1152_c0_g1_i4.p1 TRINITY_DN1152_c0_g1~~TRINITY_DN1152_c0_g1_i4.p1  ORF type:complete len:251 (+),score=75.18 TRINITY_DN1152_c0_g1_i4:3-755(+)
MAAAAEEDARMAEKSGCEAVSLVTRLREELESMKEVAAMASSKRLKAPASSNSKGGQSLNDCGWDFDEDNSEGFQQWGAYGGGQERGEAQEEEEDGGSQERQQFEGQSSTGKDRESGEEEEEKVQAQDSKALFLRQLQIWCSCLAFSCCLASLLLLWWLWSASTVQMNLPSPASSSSSASSTLLTSHLLDRWQATSLAMVVPVISFSNGMLFLMGGRWGGAYAGVCWLAVCCFILGFLVADLLRGCRGGG